MGSQHPSPNVKTFCNFTPQIWPEIITSRDAESTWFEGSRPSCDEITLGNFWANFWPEKLTSRDGCSCRSIGKRAEYCFKSTVSEKRTHWVLRQTRWVLRQTRWVRVHTQIIGWEELTEFAPRNSVSPEKLTEFGVWNRTPRNRIRPVSEVWQRQTALSSKQWWPSKRSHNSPGQGRCTLRDPRSSWPPRPSAWFSKGLSLLHDWFKYYHLSHNYHCDRNYPLTRNYYENNSLRIIFCNFWGVLCSRNVQERKTFQGITREIRNFSENNCFRIIFRK